MSEELQSKDLSKAFANMFTSDTKTEYKKSQTEPVKTTTMTQESKQESVSDNEVDLKSQKKEETKTEEPSLDLKTEYEALKKRFDESRSWGHKKNSAYINAKKKMTEFLSQLQEDSVIADDDVKVALSCFDISDDSSDILENTSTKNNPYIKVKENLDKEFSVFKKYSKIEDAEEKYQAFFSFLPLFPAKEQEKIINYMMNETPDVVIDNVMLLGGDVYENLHVGAETAGGIIPFVKSLKEQVEKLEKRNKELEAELDATEGVVYNRSINSKVSNIQPSKQKQNFADIWQNRS